MATCSIHPSAPVAGDVDRPLAQEPDRLLGREVAPSPVIPADRTVADASISRRPRSSSAAIRTERVRLCVQTHNNADRLPSLERVPTSCAPLGNPGRGVPAGKLCEWVHRRGRSCCRRPRSASTSVSSCSLRSTPAGSPRRAPTSMRSRPSWPSSPVRRRSPRCRAARPALHLALMAVGVERGDDVLVSDLTFGASAFATTYLGARPCFVDCDPDTWQIDPDLLADELADRAASDRLPGSGGQRRPVRIDGRRAAAGGDLRRVRRAARRGRGRGGRRRRGTACQPAGTAGSACCRSTGTRS